MDETKQEDKSKEEEKSKEPADDSDKGVQPETDEQVKQLNTDTERINKAIAENENAKARQKLSGVADAGQTAVKKEETPVEYKNRIEGGDI